MCVFHGLVQVEYPCEDTNHTFPGEAVLDPGHGTVCV